MSGKAHFEVFPATVAPDPDSTTQFEAHERWYFRLVAANGEKVAQSESYTREEDAERGAVDAAKAALESLGISDLKPARDPLIEHVTE